MSEAVYKVLVRDHSGNLMAVVDDYQHLAYYRRINEPGSFYFVVEANSNVAQYLLLDYEVEIWRSWHEYDVDWYIEFEGFCRSRRIKTADNGENTLHVNGVGYADLLNRRIVGYKSGNTYADKDGPAESVLKEYVRENLGHLAISPPRLRHGVLSGLTIETDTHKGEKWTGGQAYKRLLVACQEIAEISNIDFDVVGTGGYTWDFRTYENQRGSDRTQDGLDVTTGLNAAGNPPMVFSPEIGNVNTPEYEYERTTEINCAYVTGQGIYDEREVSIVTLPSLIDDSPINLREGNRDARFEPDRDNLAYLGENMLLRREGYERFNFTPIQQQASSIYGKHYFFGDRVGFSYFGHVDSKKIVGIDCVVDANVEKFQFELRDRVY